MSLKVYAVGECDWFAAEDVEGAKAAAAKFYGDAETLDEAMESGIDVLDDADMDRLRFVREDDSRVTFREQLAQMVADGEEFPCFFASSEY
ncbi:MAG: hypothetical protein ACREF8_02345 [Chthoniobacterales bacterium]